MQTLSLFEKRSASGTLVCDQVKKKAGAKVEVPPTKAVPEVVRGRPPPQMRLSKRCHSMSETERLQLEKERHHQEDKAGRAAIRTAT